MISKGTPVWMASDSRQAAIFASSLRAGTMMETVGAFVIVSFPIRWFVPPKPILEAIGFFRPFGA